MCLLSSSVDALEHQPVPTRRDREPVDDRSNTDSIGPATLDTGTLAKLEVDPPRRSSTAACRCSITPNTTSTSLSSFVNDVREEASNRPQVSHSNRSHRRTGPGAASGTCHPPTGANVSSIYRDHTSTPTRRQLGHVPPRPLKPVEEPVEETQTAPYGAVCSSGGRI